MKPHSSLIYNPKKRRDTYLVLSSLLTLARICKENGLEAVLASLEETVAKLKEVVQDGSGSIYHGSAAYQAEHLQLAQQVDLVLRFFRCPADQMMALVDAFEVLNVIEKEKLPETAVH